MSKYELRSQLESGVNNGNLPFWVSILLPFFFCCTGREGSLGETLVDNIEISCFSCHLVKTRGPHCAVTLSPWWTFDSHMAASPSCGSELFHMRRCSEQGDNQRGKNLKRNVIKRVPVFVWLTWSVIHSLSSSTIFIPLFICIQELSPGHMSKVKNGSLLVVVGDFACGKERFNFIPCL